MHSPHPGQTPPGPRGHLPFPLLSENVHIILNIITACFCKVLEAKPVSKHFRSNLHACEHTPKRTHAQTHAHFIYIDTYTIKSRTLFLQMQECRPLLSDCLSGQTVSTKKMRGARAQHCLFAAKLLQSLYCRRVAWAQGRPYCVVHRI